MAATRLPSISNHQSKIQLERITHVYFEHRNLELFSQFAKDFGFVEACRDGQLILYRGYGKDPYCYVAHQSDANAVSFGGAAFVAQTEAEFNKATNISGAVVCDLSSFPGGGRRVTLTTPSGFKLHVVYGQEERETEDSAPSAQVESFGPLNGSMKKQRYNQFQRFHPGPAMVHKLGHYGFIVKNWEEEIRWYTDNFNFVPSDVQYEPNNEDLDLISFLHLDLGERFSDHHCLFLARASPDDHDHMHHTSFEVEDFDTQLLGHEWLGGKGYMAVWGVGRHILGSQIFDYWRDPSGFTIEHYADGDQVNIQSPTNRSKAGPMSVWGPEYPTLMNEDATKMQSSTTAVDP